MNFKAHNILLDSGATTIKNQKLTADTRLWLAAREAIEFFIPDTKYLSAIDLGCYEGGHSVELARMGMRTIGLEARQDNIDRCDYVKYNLDLPHLTFLKGDAKMVDRYGTFDVTFCAGLLYHLDNPIEMIKRMAEATKQLLIINTHVAPEGGLRYKLGFLNNYIIGPIQKRTGILQYRHNYRLSEITEHKGYRGRWFKEYDIQASRESIEKADMSAYNNNRSFWLCKDELVRALKAAGFMYVFEQPDFSDDMMRDYKEYHSRCMIVAVK